MSQTVEFQFRRRYGLPPNDPRFLDCTREEILTDWWAHQHVDDPGLRNEVAMDDEDFQAELAAMEAEAAGRDDAAPAPSPGDDEDDFEPVIEDTYGEPEP